MGIDQTSQMDNTNRYGLSKLMNVLFTNELQRRFIAEGVHAFALSAYPGSVKSGKSSRGKGVVLWGRVYYANITHLQKRFTL